MQDIRATVEIALNGADKIAHLPEVPEVKHNILSVLYISLNVMIWTSIVC